MRTLIYCFGIICLLLFLGSGCEYPNSDPTPGTSPPPGTNISLELSWGSIDFREDIYEYSLAVPDNINFLTITPTYNEGELQMRINNMVVESGETSEDLALEYGVENIINLDLIREDVWDSHYEIKVRINSLKRQTVTYDYVNDSSDRYDIYDYDEQRLNHTYSIFIAGNLNYLYYYKYNADRQTVRSQLYQKGVNNYNYYYFYDNNGLLTDAYCYNQDGVLYYKDKYEYINEKRTRRVLTYTSGTVYTYDYEYNYRGLQERYTAYTNGVFSYVNVYTYDNQGKLIINIRYSNENETTITHKWDYEYNEMGYLSKTIKSRTSNDYVATYEYEFYDF